MNDGWCFTAMDGDRDLDDHRALSDGLVGPRIPPDPTVPGCTFACLVAFDFDDDGDTYLADAAVFQQSFTARD